MFNTVKYIILSLLLFATAFMGGCKDNKHTNEEPFGVLMSSSDTIIFYQVGAKDSLRFEVNSPTEKQTIFMSYDDELIRVTLKGFVVNPSSNYEFDLRGENIMSVELLKPFSTSLKLDIKISQSTYSPTPFEKPITVKFSEDAVLDHLPTKRFTVSKRETVKWNILRKGVLAPSTELFPVTAKVIQGKGVVHLAGDMVWCDTIPDFGQYVKECGSVFGGMFTPLSIGEHKVEYTVWDKQFKTETKTVVSYFADSTKFGNDISLSSTPWRFDNQQILQSFHVAPEHFVETSYYVRFEGFDGKVYLWDRENKVRVQEGDKLPANIANEIKHPDENRFGGQIFFELRTDEKYLMPVQGTVYVGDSWGTEYKWPMVVQGVDLDEIGVYYDIEELREIGEGGRKLFNLRFTQFANVSGFEYSYKITKGNGRVLDKDKNPLDAAKVYSTIGEVDEKGTIITPMYFECAGVAGGNEVELEFTVKGEGGKETVNTKQIKVVKTLPVVTVNLPAKLNTRNFDITLNMSKQDYIGKLTVAYTVVTSRTNPGAGSFNVPTNAQIGVGDNKYSYTATVCGKTLIKFKVSDEFGWSKEFVQEFEVNPIEVFSDNELSTGVQPVKPMYENNPDGTIEFEVKDNGYSGEFLFLYENLTQSLINSQTGERLGVLLLDGKEIESVVPVKISAGKHTIFLKKLKPGAWGKFKCSISHLDEAVATVFGIYF